jgi:hypothetical protein
MPDLNITNYGWGGDLSLTPSGDIQTVDGSAMGVQRVIRRLFTNPLSLIFHPEYGAGLLAKIGRPIAARTIQALCRVQMFQEAAVSQDPPPKVVDSEIPIGSGRQIINVTYQDRETGAPMLLSFDPTATPPSS